MVASCPRPFALHLPYPQYGAPSKDGTNLQHLLQYQGRQAGYLVWKQDWLLEMMVAAVLVPVPEPGPGHEMGTAVAERPAKECHSQNGVVHVLLRLDSHHYCCSTEGFGSVLHDHLDDHL